ncbi:MAG: MFS transporter [Armatimonadota bacterium]
MNTSAASPSQFVDTPAWYLRTSAFWFATSFKWFILFILLPLQVGTLAKTGEANQAWGQVVAFGAAWAMIGPALFGWLSDRSLSKFGKRRPFIAIGAAMTVVALAFLGAANSLPLMMIGYLFLQVSDDVVTGPYASVLPDIVPMEHRGKASGIIGLLQLSAQIVAAVVGFLLSSNLLAVYGAIAAVNLICGLVVVISLKETPPTSLGTVATGQFFQLNDWVAPWRCADFRYVWFSRALVALGFYIITNYAVNYMKDVVKVFAIPGVITLKDPMQAAIAIVLLMSISGAAISVAAGRWVDTIGRRKVTIWSGSAMFITLIPFALIPRFDVILIVGLLFGAAYGVYMASSVAMVADVLPDAKSSAKDMGIWQASVSSPQIVSGLCGVLVDAINRHQAGLGYASAFLISAGAFLLGCQLVRRIKGSR